MENSKKFIINNYTYERMVDNECSGPWESYEEFLEWNMKCLTESPPDDAIWLTGLCKRIKNSKIKLMDEESCSQFQASEFFFDSDKNIVIVNPR